jgi:DNA (cytosine-5)-methyltransferase 1
MPWVDWKWCAEIESFPCSLIAERHPNAPNLGDITAADFTKRATPVDLLIAGTPCQAFSVAGLRKSLSDNRGNLTLRFMEVVHELRPRFTLWENVPGVLSTDDNAFGCFLAGLVGADEAIDSPTGWESAGVVSGPLGTAAWRILDAQYFGLAQRRARLFLVFCFGDSADPAEILFEFESLRRDTPPSREAGQRVAPTTEGRAGRSGANNFATSGGLIGPSDVAMCLNGKGGAGRIDAESETFVLNGMSEYNGSKPSLRAKGGDCAGGSHALRADGFDASEDGTGCGTPLVAETLRSHPRPGSNTVGAVIAFRASGQEGFTPAEITPPLIAMPLRAGRQYSDMGDGQANIVPVAFQESQTGCREYGSAGTLRSNGPGHDPVGTRIREGMAVRRLTPLECERLQGFPDSYTAVDHNRKPAADGPRYKALGNSMAVPVLAWIGRRICEISPKS